MRKLLVVVLVLGVLGAGGWFAYQQFNQAQAAGAPAWDVVRVTRGDIAATVSATCPDRTPTINLTLPASE